MTTPTFEQAPQRQVRIAGVLYLAIIVLGLYGETAVRGALVVAGDPTATAQAIAAAPQLWRAGIVGDLLMHLLDIPVIVVLYLLLKPVSKPLALLATAFNLIQTAVLALNKLNLLVPLFLLQDAAYLSVYAPEQLHALSYLAIKAHSHGFGIGLLFFGMACLVRGWLIYRSGYFPRFLGVLLVLAGIGYLLNSFALLLAPAFAAAIFPAILVPAFVGELALSLWLVIKGVDLGKWQQRPA